MGREGEGKGAKVGGALEPQTKASLWGSPTLPCSSSPGDSMLSLRDKGQPDGTGVNTGTRRVGVMGVSFGGSFRTVRTTAEFVRQLSYNELAVA